jgi:sporulation protein YlmC with PRC-barrel domain
MSSGFATEKYVLHRVKDLEGYTIGALDGVIGHVKDFYFDDESWVIRYLVVQTGQWLLHRNVLISPIAINQPNWSKHSFPAVITQEQVKNSPSIDTDKPVSRQHEKEYLGYYGYPHYWVGGGLWGWGVNPGMMLGGGLTERTTTESSRAQAEKIGGDADGNSNSLPHDPHLRSGNEISSYDVHAEDGDIGRVQGILVDEKSWAIRYLIVNTSNWWLGHQVLISPQWIVGVSWNDRKVSVSLNRGGVKVSPPYAPGSRVERDEEASIYDHYRRPGYWAREVQLQNPEFRNIPLGSPTTTYRNL